MTIREAVGRARYSGVAMTTGGVAAFAANAVDDASAVAGVLA
jgi:hypothetical protein